MPYKWVDPEIVLDYFGIKIYHVYKDDSVDNRYEYCFTTDITGTEESEYAFDVRDLEEYKIANEDTIKTLSYAIENQSLDMPEDCGYHFKIGSFDWYYRHPHSFIKNLATALQYADGYNQGLLGSIFPHLVSSYNIHSYSTVVDGTVIKAPKGVDTEREQIPYTSESAHCGSFYWYLFRSGNYVTFLARAIQVSDETYRKIIWQMYPQMIAAFNMADWNVAPPVFQPLYDAR